MIWREQVSDVDGFDDWLQTPPEIVDHAEERLMRAFGLRQ